jgi:hypothetical protein
MLLIIFFSRMLSYSSWNVKNLVFYTARMRVPHISIMVICTWSVKIQNLVALEKLEDLNLECDFFYLELSGFFGAFIIRFLGSSRPASSSNSMSCNK